MTEIEEYGKIKLKDENRIKCIVNDLILLCDSDMTNDIIDKKVKKLRLKYRILPSKSQMRYIYEKYYGGWGFPLCGK